MLHIHNPIQIWYAKNQPISSISDSQSDYWCTSSIFYGRKWHFDCLSVLVSRCRMLSSTAFTASAACTIVISYSTLTRLHCGYQLYCLVTVKFGPYCGVWISFALDSAVSHSWTILDVASNMRSVSANSRRSLCLLVTLIPQICNLLA